MDTGVTDFVAIAEQVFDGLNEGVAVTDCQQPNYPIVYVNRAFERLTGYPAEEVLGKNPRFLQGPEKDQPGLQRLRAALRNGEECTVLVRNHRRDGVLFYNELHVSPVRNAIGEVTHYVGIQHDVTERITTQEQLQKLNSGLNDAVRRLEELVLMAGHDLKGPLTSLMFSLDILHENCGTLPRDQMERQIDDLRRHVRYLRDIVVDVLEARQVAGGVLLPVVQSIDLGLKARTVLEFYRDQARSKDIALELNIPPDLPRARADRQLTLTVIDNLLSNAIKFSPPGSRVRVDLSATAAALRLAVADEGPGISEEDSPRLFTRFARLSAQPTAGEHSTGIGLYLVKTYMDAMGGRVWYENTPGGGATFGIELPRGDDTGTAAENPEPPTARKEGK